MAAAAAAANNTQKEKRDTSFQKDVFFTKSFHNYSDPCISSLSNSYKKSHLLFEEKKILN